MPGFSARKPKAGPANCETGHVLLIDIPYPSNRASRHLLHTPRRPDTDRTERSLVVVVDFDVVVVGDYVDFVLTEVHSDFATAG